MRQKFVRLSWPLTQPLFVWCGFYSMHHGIDFECRLTLNNTSPLRMRPLIGIKYFVYFSLSLAGAGTVWASDLSKANKQFIEDYCVECHDSQMKKGGLDLT